MRTKQRWREPTPDGKPTVIPPLSEGFLAHDEKVAEMYGRGVQRAHEPITEPTANTDQHEGPSCLYTLTCGFFGHSGKSKPPASVELQEAPGSTSYTRMKPAPAGDNEDGI